MHAEKKFNPSRELGLELLTYAYTNKNLNNYETLSKAEQYEKQIYKTAISNENYWIKILDLISTKFLTDNNSELNHDLIKRCEKLFKILITAAHPKKSEKEINEFFENLFNKFYEGYDLVMQKRQKTNNNTFEKRTDQTQFFINEIKKILNELFNKYNLKSPETLKTLIKKSITKNALLFSKINNMNENEIPTVLKEELQDLKTEIDSGLYYR